MSKPKLLFTYLCLVGLPLLGLLAILRVGEQLTPPQSVSGVWKLEADFTSLADKACQDLLSGVRQPFLSISQSGTSLAFTLNNAQRTILPGTLQDASVSAGAETRLDSGGCLDPRAIRLRAQIARETGERILIGTLSIASCPSCAPIPFQARRQTSSQNEGR